MGEPNRRGGNGGSAANGASTNNGASPASPTARAQHNHDTAQAIADAFRGKPLHEVEAAYQEAVTNVHDIQAQLSSRPKRGPNGERLSATAFAARQQWHAKATSALRYATLRLRVLKHLIKATRRGTTPVAIDVTVDSDSEELIAAAYALIRRLYSEGVELDGDEVALMNVLGERCTEMRKVEAMATPEAT